MYGNAGTRPESARSDGFVWTDQADLWSNQPVAGRYVKYWINCEVTARYLTQCDRHVAGLVATAARGRRVGGAWAARGRRMAMWGAAGSALAARV